LNPFQRDGGRSLDQRSLKIKTVGGRLVATGYLRVS
jgi:hypothetical protein